MFVAKLKAAGTALAVAVAVLALGALGLSWSSAQAQARVGGPEVPAVLRDRLVAAPQEQRKVEVVRPEDLVGKFVGELEEVDVKANRISVREQKVLSINAQGQLVASDENRAALENLSVGKAKITVDGAEAKIDDLKQGMQVQLHLEVRGRLILKKIEAHSSN